MKNTATQWRDLAAIWQAAAAPRLPLDEWAAKHRRVVGGPRPGPWNPRNAPMAIEPMRALSDRRVEIVGVVSPAQLMKSELAINGAIGTAAHGEDVLFYEPDREVLTEFMRDRIRPALVALEDGSIIESADNPMLKKRDSALAIRLAGGGKILGLTPQMKTGKSAYTAPWVILDELDKMADPSMITVARSRTTTYGSDAKILAVSTPTIDAPGTIWRLWSDGSRGRWHGKCPHCRELVQMGWSRQRIPFEKDDGGFWLPHTCHGIVCDSCGSVWSESDRQRAIRAGAYIHERPDHPYRTFHIPGTAHLWRSLRSIVEEGAAVDKGARLENTWDTYQLFFNERLGECWSNDYQGLSARRMQRTTYSLGARGLNDLGELDRRVVLITAGSDVHGKDIRTEFVAWGIEPKTGQVLSWGLQYRIIGGGPEDDIEDPPLWRTFFKMIDKSVWRHAAYPGRLFGAHRVLVDANWRGDVVRPHLTNKYKLHAQKTGMDIIPPYGARILPCRGLRPATGNHLIDLSEGNKQRVGGKPIQYPAIVGLYVHAIKDAIYEVQLRDNSLAEGAPRQNMWPTDREALGYTEEWFQEMANEVRIFHRTPKGVPTYNWDVKVGKQRKNHAWDARVYAVGAAVVHCQMLGTLGLQAGLLKRALSQDSVENRWTADETEAMRKHLDILGASDYGSRDNVTRLR